MTLARDAVVLALPDAAPEIDDTAFVASGARVVGDVRLSTDASVWYNAVLRGDSASITVGARSNVQDNVSVHVDAGRPSSSAPTSRSDTTPSCTGAPSATVR